MTTNGSDNFDGGAFQIKPVFSPERSDIGFKEHDSEFITVVIKTEPLSDEEETHSIEPEVDPEPKDNITTWSLYPETEVIKEEPVLAAESPEIGLNPYQNFEGSEVESSCLDDLYCFESIENIPDTLSLENSPTKKCNPLLEHSYFQKSSGAKSKKQKEVSSKTKQDTDKTDESASVDETADFSENHQSYFVPSITNNQVPSNSSITSVYDEMVQSYPKVSISQTANEKNVFSSRSKPSILRKSSGSRLATALKISDCSLDHGIVSSTSAISELESESVKITESNAELVIDFPEFNWDAVPDFTEQVAVGTSDQELTVIDAVGEGRDAPCEAVRPQCKSKWKAGKRRKRRIILVTVKKQEQFAVEDHVDRNNVNDDAVNLSFTKAVEKQEVLPSPMLPDDFDNSIQKQDFLAGFQLGESHSADASDNKQSGCAMQRSKCMTQLKAGNFHGAKRGICQKTSLHSNDLFQIPVDLNPHTFDSKSLVYDLKVHNESVVCSGSKMRQDRHSLLNKCGKCGLSLNLKPRLLAQDLRKSRPDCFNCFFCCASYTRATKAGFKMHLGGHILSFFFKCCNKNLGFNLSFDYDVHRLVEKYMSKAKKKNSTGLKQENVYFDDFSHTTTNGASETSQKDIENIRSYHRDYDFDNGQISLSDGEYSVEDDSFQDCLEPPNDFPTESSHQYVPIISETFTLSANNWDSDSQFTQNVSRAGSEPDEVLKCTANQDSAFNPSSKCNESVNSYEVEGQTEFSRMEQDTDPLLIKIDRPMTSLENIDEKFAFVSDLKQRHFVKLYYDTNVIDSPLPQATCNGKILSCLSDKEIREHSLRVRNGCSRLPVVVLHRISDDTVRKYTESCHSATEVELSTEVSSNSMIIDAETWKLRVSRKLEKIARQIDEEAGGKACSFQECRKCHTNFIKHSKVDSLTQIGILYPCSQCFYNFDIKPRFKRHIKIHHPFAGPFVCHLCNLTCNHWFQFVYHVKLHDMNRYLCENCSIPVNQNVSECTWDILIRSAQRNNHNFRENLKAWVLKNKHANLIKSECLPRVASPSMDVIYQIIGVEPESNFVPSSIDPAAKISLSTTHHCNSQIRSIMESSLENKITKRKRGRPFKRMPLRAKLRNRLNPSMHSKLNAHTHLTDPGSCYKKVKEVFAPPRQKESITPSVHLAEEKTNPVLSTSFETFNNVLLQQIKASYKVVANYVNQPENQKDFDIFELYMSLGPSHKNSARSQIDQTKTSHNNASKSQKKRGKRWRKSRINNLKLSSLKKVPCKIERTANPPNSAESNLEFNELYSGPKDFDSLPRSPLFDFDCDNDSDNRRSLLESLKHCKEILDKDVCEETVDKQLPRHEPEPFGGTYFSNQQLDIFKNGECLINPSGSFMKLNRQLGLPCDSDFSSQTCSLSESNFLPVSDSCNQNELDAARQTALQCVSNFTPLSNNVSQNELNSHQISVLPDLNPAPLSTAVSLNSVDQSEIYSSHLCNILDKSSAITTVCSNNFNQNELYSSHVPNIQLKSSVLPSNTTFDQNESYSLSLTDTQLNSNSTTVESIASDETNIVTEKNSLPLSTTVCPNSFNLNESNSSYQTEMPSSSNSQAESFDVSTSGLYQNQSCGIGLVETVNTIVKKMKNVSVESSRKVEIDSVSVTPPVSKRCISNQDIKTTAESGESPQAMLVDLFTQVSQQKWDILKSQKDSQATEKFESELFSENLKAVPLGLATQSLNQSFRRSDIKVQRSSSEATVEGKLSPSLLSMSEDSSFSCFHDQTFNSESTFDTEIAVAEASNTSEQVNDPTTDNHFEGFKELYVTKLNEEIRILNNSAPSRQLSVVSNTIAANCSDFNASSCHMNNDDLLLSRNLERPKSTPNEILLSGMTSSPNLRLGSENVIANSCAADASLLGFAKHIDNDNIVLERPKSSLNKLCNSVDSGVYCPKIFSPKVLIQDHERIESAKFEKFAKTMFKSLHWQWNHKTPSSPNSLAKSDENEFISCTSSLPLSKTLAHDWSICKNHDILEDSGDETDFSGAISPAFCSGDPEYRVSSPIKSVTIEPSMNSTKPISGSEVPETDINKNQSFCTSKLPKSNLGCGLKITSSENLADLCRTTNSVSADPPCQTSESEKNERSAFVELPELKSPVATGEFAFEREETGKIISSPSPLEFASGRTVNPLNLPVPAEDGAEVQRDESAHTSENLTAPMLLTTGSVKPQQNCGFISETNHVCSLISNSTCVDCNAIPTSGLDSAVLKFEGYFFGPGSLTLPRLKTWEDTRQDQSSPQSVSNDGRGPSILTKSSIVKPSVMSANRTSRDPLFCKADQTLVKKNVFGNSELEQIRDCNPREPSVGFHCDNTSHPLNLGKSAELVHDSAFVHIKPSEFCQTEQFSSEMSFDFQEDTHASSSKIILKSGMIETESSNREHSAPSTKNSNLNIVDLKQKRSPLSKLKLKNRKSSVGDKLSVALAEVSQTLSALLSDVEQVTDTDPSPHFLAKNLSSEEPHHTRLSFDFSDNGVTDDVKPLNRSREGSPTIAFQSFDCNDSLNDCLDSILKKTKQKNSQLLESQALLRRSNLNKQLLQKLEYNFEQEQCSNQAQSDTDSNYSLRLSAHPCRIFPSLKKPVRKRKFRDQHTSKVDDWSKTSGKSKCLLRRKQAREESHQNSSTSNVSLENCQQIPRNHLKSYLKSSRIVDKVRGGNEKLVATGRGRGYGGRFVKANLKPSTKQKNSSSYKPQNLRCATSNPSHFKGMRNILTKKINCQNLSQDKSLSPSTKDRDTSSKVYDFDLSSECEKFNELPTKICSKQCKREPSIDTVPTFDRKEEQITSTGSSKKREANSTTNGIGDTDMLVKPSNLESRNSKQVQIMSGTECKSNVKSRRKRRKRLLFCIRKRSTLTTVNKRLTRTSPSRCNLLTSECAEETSHQNETESDPSHDISHQARLIQKKIIQRKIHSSDVQRSLRPRNSNQSIDDIPQSTVSTVEPKDGSVPPLSAMVKSGKSGITTFPQKSTHDPKTSINSKTDPTSSLRNQSGLKSKSMQPMSVNSEILQSQHTAVSSSDKIKRKRRRRKVARKFCYRSQSNTYMQLAKLRNVSKSRAETSVEKACNITSDYNEETNIEDSIKSSSVSVFSKGRECAVSKAPPNGEAKKNNRTNSVVECKKETQSGLRDESACKKRRKRNSKKLLFTIRKKRTVQVPKNPASLITVVPSDRCETEPPVRKKRRKRNSKKLLFTMHKKRTVPVYKNSESLIPAVPINNTSSLELDINKDTCNDKPDIEPDTNSKCHITSKQTKRRRRLKKLRFSIQKKRRVPVSRPKSCIHSDLGNVLAESVEILTEVLPDGNAEIADCDSSTDSKELSSKEKQKSKEISLSTPNLSSLNSKSSSAVNNPDSADIPKSNLDNDEKVTTSTTPVTPEVQVSQEPNFGRAKSQRSNRGNRLVEFCLMIHVPGLPRKPKPNASPSTPNSQKSKLGKNLKSVEKQIVGGINSRTDTNVGKTNLKPSNIKKSEDPIPEMSSSGLEIKHEVSGLSNTTNLKDCQKWRRKSSKQHLVMGKGKYSEDSKEFRQTYSVSNNANVFKATSDQENTVLKSVIPPSENVINADTQPESSSMTTPTTSAGSKVTSKPHKKRRRISFKRHLVARKGCYQKYSKKFGLLNSNPDTSNHDGEKSSINSEIVETPSNTRVGNSLQKSVLDVPENRINTSHSLSSDSVNSPNSSKHRDSPPKRGLEGDAISKPRKKRRRISFRRHLVARKGCYQKYSKKFRLLNSDLDTSNSDEELSINSEELSMNSGLDMAPSNPRVGNSSLKIVSDVTEDRMNASHPLYSDSVNSPNSSKHCDSPLKRVLEGVKNRKKVSGKLSSDLLHSTNSSKHRDSPSKRVSKDAENRNESSNVLCSNSVNTTYSSKHQNTCSKTISNNSESSKKSSNTHSSESVNSTNVPKHRDSSLKRKPKDAENRNKSSDTASHDPVNSKHQDTSSKKVSKNAENGNKSLNTPSSNSESCTNSSKNRDASFEKASDDEESRSKLLDLLFSDSASTTNSSLNYAKIGKKSQNAQSPDSMNVSNPPKSHHDSLMELKIDKRNYLSSEKTISKTDKPGDSDCKPKKLKKPQSMIPLKSKKLAKPKNTECTSVSSLSEGVQNPETVAPKSKAKPKFAEILLGTEIDVMPSFMVDNKCKSVKNQSLPLRCRRRKSAETPESNAAVEESCLKIKIKTNNKQGTYVIEKPSAEPKSVIDSLKSSSTSKIKTIKKQRNLIQRPDEISSEPGNSTESSRGRKRKQKEKKFRKTLCRVTKSLKMHSNRPPSDTDCSLSSLDPAPMIRIDKNKKESSGSPKTKSKEALKLFFSVNLPTLKPSFSEVSAGSNVPAKGSAAGLPLLDSTQSSVDTKSMIEDCSAIKEQPPETQYENLVSGNNLSAAELSRLPSEGCSPHTRKHSINNEIPSVVINNVAAQKSYSTGSLAPKFSCDTLASSNLERREMKNLKCQGPSPVSEFSYRSQNIVFGSDDLMNTPVIYKNSKKVFSEEDKEKVLKLMSQKIDQVTVKDETKNFFLDKKVVKSGSKSVSPRSKEIQKSLLSKSNRSQKSLSFKKSPSSPSVKNEKQNEQSKPFDIKKRNLFEGQNWSNSLFTASRDFENHLHHSDSVNSVKSIDPKSALTFQNYSTPQPIDFDSKFFAPKPKQTILTAEFDTSRKSNSNYDVSMAYYSPMPRSNQFHCNTQSQNEFVDAENQEFISSSGFEVGFTNSYAQLNRYMPSQTFYPTESMNESGSQTSSQQPFYPDFYSDKLETNHTRPVKVHTEMFYQNPSAFHMTPPVYSSVYQTTSIPVESVTNDSSVFQYSYNTPLINTQNQYSECRQNDEAHSTGENIVQMENLGPFSDPYCNYTCSEPMSNVFTPSVEDREASINPNDETIYTTL